MYLDNIEREFGPYELAERKTPFVPELLNYYVQKMMNGKQSIENLQNSQQSNADSDQCGASGSGLLHIMMSPIQPRFSLFYESDENDFVEVSGDEFDDSNYSGSTIEQFHREEEQIEQNMMDQEPTRQSTMEVNDREIFDVPPNQGENSLTSNDFESILKRRNTSKTELVDDRIAKRAKISPEDDKFITNLEKVFSDAKSLLMSKTEQQNQLKDALKNANAGRDEANAELQRAVADHKEEIRLLNESKVQQVEDLLAKVEQMQRANVELKKEIDEIREEKDKEVNKAVEHIKKQEMEYSKLIKDAKMKAYCMACGTEKDEVITCNRECAKRYW